MQFTEVKNEGLDRHFKVTIPSQNIDAKIKAEIEKIALTARMPGFRVGKVPFSHLEKKYGESIKGDIISNEMRGSVGEIIKKHNLNPATTPNVSDLKMEKGQDLEFLVEFELTPEITMPDFKKINITKPVVEIEEKDLKKHLDQVAEMNQNFTDAGKDVKSVEGNRLVIDFVGSIDGTEFPGGASKGHELVLGSKTFIPGFEDQLIGKVAGDKVVVKVNFPESYHAKDLAGKAAEFQVTVHEVQKAETAKLDDELAKKIGCKDLAELKKRVSDGVLAGYQEQIHTFMKMDLFDKLESDLKFDPPKSMLKAEFEALKRQSQQFLSNDESMKGKSEEELDKYYNRISSRRIKIGLMLAEYAKSKNIKIEQKDVQQAVMNEARNFPGQETAIFDYYSKNPNALEALSGPIMEEKAVKAIFDNEVIISEKKYSVEEIEKFLEAESERDII